MKYQKGQLFRGIKIVELHIISAEILFQPEKNVLGNFGVKIGCPSIEANKESYDSRNRRIHALNSK